MAFDSEAFLRAKFIPREAEVPVGPLKEFFGEDEVPVWKCKSLTGMDLGIANAAASKEYLSTAKAMLEALHSRYKVKVDAFKSAMGLGKETPADIAKRIEMMLRGSVELDPENPKSLDIVLKICEKFAIEFYMITDKILELTGQGHIVGKPKPSGKKELSSTV